MIPQQKRGALSTISFLKEKRHSCLKGRTYTDGSKHRSSISKEELLSPTVSTKTLVARLVIYAQKGRYLATINVVGAYLNMDMDNFAVMITEGAKVDFMVKANPTSIPNMFTRRIRKGTVCEDSEGTIRLHQVRFNMVIFFLRDAK